MSHRLQTLCLIKVLVDEALVFFIPCRYSKVTCKSDKKMYVIDLGLLDFGASYTFILGGVRDVYLSVVNVLPNTPWVYLSHRFQGQVCRLEYWKMYCFNKYIIEI